MKTNLPLKMMFTILMVCAVTVGFTQTNIGLKFKNAQLVSGTNLKKDAVYLFPLVYTGVDARVKIDSLINGAEINKIDDDSKNLGYLDAFQPEIKSPGGLRSAYAVFSFTFYEAGTNNPTTLDNVQGTALDLDGNALVKEFCEIDMGGGVATFKSTSLDISVVQLLLSKFRATNILGIERDGIDTSAMGNMYTVTKTAVSTLKVRFGINTITSGSQSRQFSMYMKGFDYPQQITLPVELVSFNAMLNTNKVDLKWVTASEKNVSHFSIEKSLDGKVFSEAGVVFAYGNTSETMKYSFTDNSINTSQPGVIYYRLRSIDIDGKNQVSQTRAIRIGQQNDQVVKIVTYPNPVSNELRITVPANWQGKKISYEVLNNSGQSVIRTENGAASQTETVNMSKLTVGFYVVKVTCNGETAQQKVIKQ